MAESWERLGEDEALEVSCPVCHMGPGDWCVYVGKVVRSGSETRRLHVERTHQLWLQRPHRMAASTRPHAALTALREYDRREDCLLRAWLRQYVHLLIGPDSPGG